MSSTFSSTTIPTPSSTNQDTNNNSENNNSGKIIHRITLFKIPDPEHQRELLDAYRELERTAVKVSFRIVGECFVWFVCFFFGGGFTNSPAVMA